MVDALLDRAAQAVELAKRHGADGVFAHASRSRSVSCKLRNGDLETLKESTTRGVDLEIYSNGRYSSHRTTDLDPRRLEQFVRDAVALTRALQPDPHRRLPDPELFRQPLPSDLALVDNSVTRLETDERLELARRMNARMAGKDRVVSAASTFYDGHGRVAGVSSNGFSGSYEATQVGMYGYVTLRDAGDSRPEGGMGMRCRHRNQLWSPERIGDEALSRARARLGAVKGPTATTTMVVDRLAASKLVTRLLRPASGSAIQQRRSMWEGQLDRRRLASKLSIYNDPTLPGALGSAPFDGEGISSFRMPVIESGHLRNFFVDTYYARKLGRTPTTGRWANIVLAPGTRNLEAILEDVSSGIYVTSWLGGNSDATSGDFSFGLRGHRIAGGKIAEAVSEMNVTGNLLALFDRLREVGSDPWTHASIQTPTLVFDDVQFSGV